MGLEGLGFRGFRVYDLGFRAGGLPHPRLTSTAGCIPESSDAPVPNTIQQKPESWNIISLMLLK